MIFSAICTSFLSFYSWFAGNPCAKKLFSHRDDIDQLGNANPTLRSTLILLTPFYS
jgi:hypothetical protein